MTSSYEQRRLKNLEDNKRVLRELGLLNPFNPLPRVVHHAASRPKKRKRESTGSSGTPHKAFKIDDSHGSVFTPGERRRSSRLKGDSPSTPGQIDDEVKRDLAEEEEEGYRRPKIPPNRPNFYGAISDVESGTWWQTRMECSAAGIHRPWVAGIHGGEEGCLSLALSGGYEDDIDMGECFTYTGEGGRDLKGTKANPKNLRTAAQTRDQTLTRGNLALSVSVETGNPVRVIRGYKLRGPFAPEEGYRYDGLYKVEKYWFTIGLSGYGVYKFALKRLSDQAPPPWDLTGPNSCQDSGVGSEIGSATPMDGMSDAGSDDKVSETSDHEDEKNVMTKKEDPATEDNAEDQSLKQESGVDDVKSDADSKPVMVKDKLTSPSKEAHSEASSEDKDQSTDETKVEIKDEANIQDSGIDSDPSSQGSTDTASEAASDDASPAEDPSDKADLKTKIKSPSAKATEKADLKTKIKSPSAKATEKADLKTKIKSPSAKATEKADLKTKIKSPSAKATEKADLKTKFKSPSAKATEKADLKTKIKSPSAKATEKADLKTKIKSPSAKATEKADLKTKIKSPSAKATEKADLKTKIKSPSAKATEKATSPVSFFSIFKMQKK